jgi:hypothetical protein
MAAATADRETYKKPGKLVAYAMGAVQLFKGTFVFVQQADGNAYAARTTNTITDVFVGVAFENVNNSGGTAGAMKMLVEKEGDHEFVTSAATQTWVPVYALDNQTVTLTSATTNVKVGYVVEYISSTNVRVRIDNAVN